MISAMTRFTAVIFTILALSGCAAGPTSLDIANADYGTGPTQTDAESQIKSYFGRVLKDPYSARYGFSPVEKGYIVGNAIQGKPLYAGFIVYAKVNAKNSYGGYVGDKGYLFLFQNGRLVKGQEITSMGHTLDLF